MAIDFQAVRARQPLADVARRIGFHLDSDRADVMVCCPLPGHDDRTPSMILHLDDGRYHCFGCGAGGDVIKWVRDIYQIGVLEAVRLLDTPGPLPRPPASFSSGERRTATPLGRRAELPDPTRAPPERVLAALDAAWNYYSYGALHHAGVEYLKARGIHISVLETELGQPVIGRTPYKAPDQFVTNMRQRGFSDDELIDAGLATRLPARVAGAKPTVIDFHRHRFLLPIRDDNGQVIGLIGRYDGDHHADKVPKYKNPPRTIVYDKALALYRPTIRHLDPDGQVVVVEGSLDALAIAAAAAQAGLSAKYAPVSESGTALSPAQLDKVMAIHDRAPVLAADGDPTGQGASTKWATALALRGRESAIVTWPEGEDPASWLEKHGTAGLTALTRKGCLQAPPDQLRPRHSGAQVAKHLIAATHGDLEMSWRAALAPARHMPDKPAERYATAAVETLAPIVVTAAIKIATDHRGRVVNDVILTVATYGRRLPSPAQVRYVELAALEIEKADLCPAGWAQRRIQTIVAEPWLEPGQSPSAEMRGAEL
jgi:DNA primase